MAGNVAESLVRGATAKAGHEPPVIAPANTSEGTRLLREFAIRHAQRFVVGYRFHEIGQFIGGTLENPVAVV